VKNKRLLLYTALIAAVAILSACQKVQLADYKRYEKDTEVPRISVEEAKKDVDAGIALIVDSRGEPAYKAERIAGSINIAFGSGADKFSTLPQGKKIIVYCS